MFDGGQHSKTWEFRVALVNRASDAALLPLVKQLRDALRNAEAELQRRCFISSEIREALQSADACLGDGGDGASNGERSFAFSRRLKSVT